MHCDSSSKVLRHNVGNNGKSGKSEDANRRAQCWSRRQRQGSSHTATQNISAMLKTCRFVFLLAVSYFILVPQACNGSEDATSSFQRPPPPRSSFSAPVTTNDYHGENNRVDDYYHRGQQQGISPPPPPPPLSAEEYHYQSAEDQRFPQQSDPTSSSPQGQHQQIPSAPIHYEFPIAEDDVMDVNGERGQRRTKNEGSIVDDKDRDVSSATSSARKDLVTQYWSTKTGRTQIQTVVGLVGYGSGSFIAKSVIGGTDVVRWTGYFWAVFLVVSTWFRTPMGELSRAVGLSLILVLQRTQRIRREYPTWRYVAASVGMIRGGPRDARGRPRGPRPFPPARNPWKYTPGSPRDPDFNMMYALVSMAMVGSTVGGNLPVIPNWIGALVGAASFAFACTWQNSHRGDLARTMGMRVVRAVSELWEIQADLQIIPKATVVSSQVIDKVMILDRKHRVKDRFLSFANKGYAQASKVADQIQKQQRGGNNENKNNNDRERSGPRSEEDFDSKRGVERDRNTPRYSRNRGRDAEDDRFDERLDDRSQRRRRYRDDDNDVEDDRFDFRVRSEPNERRGTNGRYEVEKNDRDGKFTSRRRESYDSDDGRDTFGENQSDEKSKGFFFGRK